MIAAYEYVPDSEIASVTVPTSLLTIQSGSEEDLLMDKVRLKNNFLTFVDLKIMLLIEKCSFFLFLIRIIFRKCQKKWKLISAELQNSLFHWRKSYQWRKIKKSGK